MPERRASEGPTEFSSRVHKFDNFDEFNQSVQGWAIDFRQVDRGVPIIKIRQRMTPEINVFDLKSTHATFSGGASQPGHRTFGVPGGQDGCTWCGRDVSFNQVLRFDAHEDFSTRTPPGFIGRTLSVDENLLASIAADLGFDDFLERLDRSHDILKIDPRAAGYFSRMYDGPTRHPGDLRRIVENLVLLTESACKGRSPRAQKKSSRHLDRALEFITANASEAISVADVCRELGVSYRTLDRTFKYHLGHGPKDSILACRLSGVRADLLTANPLDQVGDIARVWGFWHMGDFARIYRTEFGELPSETLGCQPGL